MSADGNATPPAAHAVAVRVWTMATTGLDEADVSRWAGVLDAAERERAARFVFPHSRITFIAAHALARAALAAVTGASPPSLGFAAGAHGKPEALLEGRPAGVAFNLSHTEGLVGVAVAAQGGVRLGFDVEPLARRAPLAVAPRVFTAGERAWRGALPAAERGEGFFRLWTLKEAFIKATGKGLTQDLSSFWFQVFPPVIGFAPELGERPADWAFEQRRVQGGFLAALAAGAPEARIDATWREVDAADFDPARRLV